jgi:hypothetical protein
MYGFHVVASQPRYVLTIHVLARRAHHAQPMNAPYASYLLGKRSWGKSNSFRLRTFCSNGELTPLDPLATTILAATVVVRRQDGALMDAAPPEVTLAEAVLGKGRAAADGAEQC